MPYVGRPPQREGSYEMLDAFVFDGSETTFDLTVGSGTRDIIPGKAANLLIVVADVQLEPETDYTVSGSEITFATAYAGATDHHGRLLGDAYKAPATIPTDLDSISDVTISSLTTDDVLKWNGSAWVNDDTVGTRHIANLDGTDISSPTSGDILTYDGSDWVNGTLDDFSIGDLGDVGLGGFGALESGQILFYIGGTFVNFPPVLAMMLDIDISTVEPVEGDLLVFNSSNLWVPGHDALAALTDVDMVSNPPSANDLLSYDGSDWVPATLTTTPHTLTAHTDVTGTPTVGQVLAWNGSEWVPSSAAGGGASAIDDLSDVDTSTVAPTNGQVLTWSSANAAWEPDDGGGGGGATIDEYFTVYVRSEGSDTTGDGTDPTPFATIAKALDYIKDIVVTKMIYIDVTNSVGTITETEAARFNHVCPITLYGDGEEIEFTGLNRDYSGIQQMGYLHISSNVHFIGVGMSGDVSLVNTFIIPENGCQIDIDLCEMGGCSAFMYNYIQASYMDNSCSRLHVRASTITMYHEGGGGHTSFDSIPDLVFGCSDMWYAWPSGYTGMAIGMVSIAYESDGGYPFDNDKILEFNRCSGQIHVNALNVIRDHQWQTLLECIECNITKLSLKEEFQSTGIMPRDMCKLMYTVVNNIYLLAGSNVDRSLLTVFNSKVLGGNIHLSKLRPWSMIFWVEYGDVHLNTIEFTDVNTFSPQANIGYAKYMSKVFVGEMRNVHGGNVSTDPTLTTSQTTPNYDNRLSIIYIPALLSSPSGTTSGEQQTGFESSTIKGTGMPTEGLPSSTGGGD